MYSQHERIASPELGRDVHLWRFGHWGQPVVVFPSAAGFAHEWQRQGMVDALRPLIEGGRIKLYCPESNVAESWTRKEGHPAERHSRHRAYEAFVVNTLVPYIRADLNPRGDERAPERLAVAGCSLGAMYAVNFALKHPEIFHWALAMSGRYEVRGFLDGYDDPRVYFDNPLAYVPNLSGVALDRARHTAITLVCGRGKYEEGCIEETIALAAALRGRRIPHECDLWGFDVAHDWAWWRRQAVHHMGRRYT